MGSWSLPNTLHVFTHHLFTFAFTEQTLSTQALAGAVLSKTDALLLAQKVDVEPTSPQTSVSCSCESCLHGACV